MEEGKCAGIRSGRLGEARLGARREDGEIAEMLASGGVPVTAQWPDSPAKPWMPLDDWLISDHSGPDGMEASISMVECRNIC